MKNKFLKIFLFLTLFFVFFLMYNNYILYNTSSVKKLFSNPSFLFSSKKEKALSFNKKYIKDNSITNTGEKNAINTFEENFSLELKNLKSEKINIISIETNNSIFEIHPSVEVSSKNRKSIYGVNNFIKIKNKYLLVINEKNVDKIIIKCIKENFEYSPVEKISINSVKINNASDFSLLKRNIMKKNMIALVLIIIFIAIIIISKMTKKFDRVPDKKLPKIFLIISIFVGCTFSFLFPLYQIPDEMTHINMIYSEMNMKVDFNKKVNSYGDTIRIMHNYDQKVDSQKYFNLNKKLKIKKAYKLPSISLIKHLPQALGLFIGDILSLPILISITLAEVFAVIFYSIICYKSLKLMPIKKELMMGVMLLPICIQQMGSFSYDVMLLSMCFLFIGYIFNYKFEKENITVIDIIKLLLILFVIGIVKLPYIILGGLIILIPLKKIDFNLFKMKIDYNYIVRHKKTIILFIIPICIISLIAFVFVLKKMYFGRILLAAIRYPKKSIPLLIGTFWSNKFGYIRGMSSEFGWLETHSSLFFTYFVMISFAFFTFLNYTRKNKKVIVQKNPFKKWEIVYMLIIAFVLIFIIILSMVDWTAKIMGFADIEKYSLSQLGDVMNALPFIGGLQGRYFVPAVPLLLIPVYFNKISTRLSKYNLSIFITVYYIVLFTYFFILILSRYWV